MRNTKLHKFEEYLNAHVVFSIEAFEKVDLPEFQISEDGIPELPLIYERHIGGGVVVSELYEFVEDVVLYLHETFHKQREIYEVLISPPIQLLKQYLAEFYFEDYSGIQYLWHKRIKLGKGSTYEDYGQHVDQEFCADDYLIISKNMRLQKDAIEHILTIHGHLLNNTGGIKPTVKIKTTMTVGELALLFRLLYDAKKLKKENTKKNICRMISASFATDTTDDISVDSLYNDWNSPEEKEINRITVLLRQMSTLLSDIDK